MFKCEITKKVTKPGEKMHRVVAERRERVYTDDDGNEIARGWEVVRELSVSDEGRRIWWEQHPEEAEMQLSSNVEAPSRTRGTSDEHREALDRGLVPIERGGRIVYVTPKEAIDRGRRDEPIRGRPAP